MNPKDGSKEKFYSGVPSNLFHDTFEIVQKYLMNGDCVTVHDADEYDRNENYLSEDGLSGISITPDGDLISVFNLQGGKGGFLKTVAPIVKEKVKTLDCFNSNAQPLPTYYERAFGFKTASVLEYNHDVLVGDFGEDYARHFEETYGTAPVHFMVNPKYAKDGDIIPRQFGKDDYDGAVAYRESLMRKG